MKKITGLILLLLLMPLGLLGNARINSVIMNPPNPTFGDVVTVTVDYCASYYAENKMAMAISTDPAKLNAGLSGVGQVFVISREGIDVPTLKPALAPGGAIDFTANTANGFIAAPPCTDCASSGAQQYTKDFIVHIPDAKYFPGCVNGSFLYMHLGMKDLIINESEWHTLGACESKSLTWTLPVPAKDFSVKISGTGSISKQGDEMIISAEYSYQNGPLMLTLTIPSIGNYSLESFGPQSAPGMAVSAPSLGSTAGTLTWTMPDTTGTVPVKKGTVWLKIKAVNNPAPLSSISSTVTGKMTGGPADKTDTLAAFTGMPSDISFTKTASSASVHMGEIITYNINYDFSRNVSLAGSDRFDDMATGTYSATAPSGWKFIPDYASGTNGTWYVEDECGNGDRHIRGDALNERFPQLLLDDNSDYSDIILQSDVKIGYGTAPYEGADALVIIRHNGLNGANMKFYGLLLTVDDAPGTAGTFVKVQKCDSGTCTWPSGIGYRIMAETWYTTKISMTKAGVINAKVWLRGDPEPAGWMLTYTDPSPMTPDNTWKPGVGEQSGSSGDVQDSYDNFMAFGIAPIPGGAIWDTIPAQFRVMGTSPGATVFYSGVTVVSWDIAGNPAIGSKSLILRADNLPCEQTVSNTAAYEYAGTTIGAYTDSSVFYYCATAVPSATFTSTPTPPVTATNTNTSTRTPTPAESGTDTPTLIVSTPTYTNTSSTTSTQTALPYTHTITRTFTQTATITITPSLGTPMTATSTRTVTPTSTITVTATSTSTPTITNTPDGFSGDDIVKDPKPGDAGGRGTCLDGSGRMLVITYEWDDGCTCYTMVIYRYLPDGTRDMSFGTGGRVVCPGPSTGSLFTDSMTIKCDSSGNIIVAGTASCGGTCTEMIIYRFLPNGSPDTSFNAGQCYRTYGSGSISSFEIDWNGRYVCAGKRFNGSDDDACIIRVNPDGSPDTTFGSGGVKLLHGPAGSNVNSAAITIKCVAPYIYVTGWSDDYETGCTGNCKSICTWKMLSDGTLDATFGTGGCSRYMNAAINHKTCIPRNMIITVSGDIIVTGSVDDGSGCTITCKSMITLVMNANGALNTAFDTDGIITGTVGTEGTCVLEVDGKLIVLFVRHNGTNTDCVMRRYNMDGTLDTTFATAGEWVYDSGSDDYCHSVLRITICRLLVAGHSYSAPTGYDQVLWNIEDMCPAHTPTLTSTVTATVSATYTATVTRTPYITLTATGTVTPSATMTITRTATIMPPTATPTMTATRTITLTVTPTVTITLTPYVTPSCNGVATPSFTVKMIFNPEHTDNVIFEIKASTVLVSAPTVTIYAHGTTNNKPVFTFTAEAVPGDPLMWRVLYPKQTGFGDIDRVVVKGTDLCAVYGESSGDFDKEVISKKDVTVYNNVIEPDKGERVTVRFNVYAGDNVKVKVYTRQGVLIKELMNKTFTQAQTGEVVWDAKNSAGNTVSSGQYIITVETSYYTATEKVAVIR